MKRIRSRRGPSGRSEGTGGYDVGYGRPPKEYRFRSGQSGNPKGRPKGAKSEETILHNLLNRLIEIREGGRARKITVREAIYLKFAEEALKGEPKAATFLLNRYRPSDSTEVSATEMSRDDQEILDAFARRLETQLKAKSS